MLIEKPNSQIAAIVPMSDTGIAIPGTSVARRLPMNSQIVATTIAMEKASVINTSLTELRMNTAWSSVTEISRFSNRSLMRSTAATTSAEISIVFDLACRITLSPSTGLPFSLDRVLVSSGPK